MARDTVPGPRGRWLVGDVTAYQRDRLAWLVASRERYGDVVRLSPEIVVVHDAELAHEVLAATNDTYMLDSTLRAGKRERARNEAHLDEWMRTRRDVWRAVAERITRLHVDRFVSEFEADLRRHSGRPVDVVNVSRTMLGRAIVDFCLGAEASRATLAEVCQAADNLFIAALRALVSGEGRVAWWPRPAARAAVAANRRLLGMLENLVRARSAGPGRDEPRDLLDALVTSSSAAPDASDVQRSVLVLRTIMFASHGVPGAALSWIVLLLAQHPELAARVAAEASGATLAVDALPYTSAFIKEALRMHPPQWLITRTASRPFELGGHRLPAGTEVLLCPYLIHRDARWWDDPERFDPDRWLGASKPHARHAYLPFGAGPRICPGSLLATVQLTLLTAVIARDYRLTLPPLTSVPVSTDGLMLPIGLTGTWHALAHRS
jgi:cytochrome P450